MRNHFLSMIFLAVMAACSSQPAQEQTTTPASAVQAVSPTHTATGKVYQVGTNFTYPPYNQRINDKIEGLDIDILNAIAKDQGFQVQYAALSWNTLMTHTAQQPYDIVMDGIAADDIADYPDYVLSQSYMRSGDCIYTLKPENTQNWQKNKIAVQPDDFLDDELVKEHSVKEEQITHAKTLIVGLQSVVRDDVQSVISDCGALRYVAKNPLFKDYHFNETILPNSEVPINADLGFGVKKADTELLNKINAGLEHIKQNGELDKIIQKWTK